MRGIRFQMSGKIATIGESILLNKLYAWAPTAVKERPVNDAHDMQRKCRRHAIALLRHGIGNGHEPTWPLLFSLIVIDLIVP